MSEITPNLINQFKIYDDIEVIERILSGENKLFEILIRRNNPYLYKVGRSYGFNHEDTEDLMQETYINAYLHLADFKNLSSLKTWIVRIMLNQCYQRTQKSAYKNEIPTELMPEEKSTTLLNNNIQDSEKLMVNKELGHLIELALKKIPLNYRMVFSLRELSGLNIKETAETLKITETNVKVRLNRAKTLLKTELEKSYSTDEIFEFNLIYCDRIVENVMHRIKAL